jgi:hypothetical protein
MGTQGDLELRLIRLVATLGFFGLVTMVAVSFAGPWGYVIGAGLFGGMTCFLWRDDLAARAKERVHRQASDNAASYAASKAEAESKATGIGRMELTSGVADHVATSRSRYVKGPGHAAQHHV